MVVGQVVDASTGAPVSEAIVRLTLPKYFNNPTAPKSRRGSIRCGRIHDFNNCCVA